MDNLDLETFRHPLPASPVVLDRSSWIAERCHGKRVLHVGCVDSGLFTERIRTATLLHAAMEAVTTKIIGIDIDSDGVDAMRREGFGRVYMIDIGVDPEQVMARLWGDLGGCDVIVCGEVLEHAPCPERLLKGLAQTAKHFQAEVLFTVPNGFSLRGFLSVAIQNAEIVHFDHKFYFSWCTLRTLLQFAGFRVVEVACYSNIIPSMSRAKRMMKWLLSKTLLSWRPFLAEGLIFVVQV